MSLINTDYIVNYVEQNIHDYIKYQNQSDGLISREVTDDFFLDYISDVSYEEIRMDGFREQGITVCGNDVLISAYDASENKNYSRIYIYNKYNGLYKGYIVLDSKAHVGGLSYDNVNGLLFVTGSNGIVNCYDYLRLKNSINELNNQYNFAINLSGENKNGYSINLDAIDYYVPTDIVMPEGYNASTVYYYKEKLYTASFDALKSGLLQINEFEVIKKDGKKIVRTTNVETMKTDRQVQGLAVTDYKGEQLLFTVSSVGFTNSAVNVYKYDEEKDKYKYRGTDYYRKNMEGIYISEIGQLYASFEYGDQKIECISIDDMLANIKDNNFVQKVVEDNIALLNGVLYSYGRKR